jgi:hypothetical protein
VFASRGHTKMSATRPVREGAEALRGDMKTCRLGKKLEGTGDLSHVNHVNQHVSGEVTIK